MAAHDGATRTRMPVPVARRHAVATTRGVNKKPCTLLLHTITHTNSAQPPRAQHAPLTHARAGARPTGRPPTQQQHQPQQQAAPPRTPPHPQGPPTTPHPDMAWGMGGWRTQGGRSTRHTTHDKRPTTTRLRARPLRDCTRGHTVARATHYSKRGGRRRPRTHRPGHALGGTEPRRAHACGAHATTGTHARTHGRGAPGPVAAHPPRLVVGVTSCHHT